MKHEQIVIKCETETAKLYGQLNMLKNIKVTIFNKRRVNKETKRINDSLIFWNNELRIAMNNIDEQIRLNNFDNSISQFNKAMDTYNNIQYIKEVLK